MQMVDVNASHNQTRQYLRGLFSGSARRQQIGEAIEPLVSSIIGVRLCCTVPLGDICVRTEMLLERRTALLLKRPGLGRRGRRTSVVLVEQ
ncbi:hypothetical protein C2U71_09960 [Burkholderia ubonensis]|nr:hypothetical protein C2U71_09960 [Burkholderia ubonensis]